MDVGLAALFPIQVHSLCSGIVGPGQPGRQRHNIIIPILPELLHIGMRRGAGGFRCIVPCFHLFQQFQLIEALIIYNGIRSHLNGQRHLCHMGALEHIGGQVRAAVANKLVRHFQNHLN